MRYIRLTVLELPHETARAALVAARRITETEEKPTLTRPHVDGVYYAIIVNSRQLRLFREFLEQRAVPYTDLACLPHGKTTVTAKKPEEKPEASPLATLFKGLVDEIFGEDGR